jgi:hypothetical protein
VATSIGDLLATLDQATQTNAIAAADAAGALDHTSRALRTLHSDGLGRDYPPGCLDAIRRLQDACSTAAVAFEHEPRRVSDLAGVLADAVATLRRELVDADRWAVATYTASIVRRCAQSIRESGPYKNVPELLGLFDRSDELQRAAAITPPDPARIRGLDAPIPTTWRPAGLSTDAAVLDAVASLAAEFRRHDRAPASVRELIAVCHVASGVAARLLPTPDPEGPTPSDTWKRARDTLVQYTDGIALPAPGEPRSSLLLKAMRVETELRRPGAATLSEERSPRRSIASEAQNQLRRLANACHAEIGRIAPTLVVLPGDRPLTNDRVGEWLRHEPFRVTLADVQPALVVLQQAANLGLPPAVIAVSI